MPSIPVTTSCWKRRRAQEDVGARREICEPAEGRRRSLPILAITFTRKRPPRCATHHPRAPARGRTLRQSRRWLEARDRISEIAISTIDAFCLSLLREFPLEADVDPGFELADETEVPRLVSTALDRALRIIVNLARGCRRCLVLAQLGLARTPKVSRRCSTGGWSRDALNRFLARGPRDYDRRVCLPGCRPVAARHAADDPGRARRIADGPGTIPATICWSARSANCRHCTKRRRRPFEPCSIASAATSSPTKARRASRPARSIRKGGPLREQGRDEAASRCRVRDRATDQDVMFAFNRDLNVVMARGVRRMFAVALDQYRSALEERSLLDFSDVLERARDAAADGRVLAKPLSSGGSIPSRPRRRIPGHESRPMELVSLLVRAWGEGLGVATNPSIFVVGDRKRSIYRFRDAELSVLEEAASFIETLRPDARARRSIARSFRAVPELLHFVNDLFTELTQPPSRFMISPTRSAIGSP